VPIGTGGFEATDFHLWI